MMQGSTGALELPGKNVDAFEPKDSLKLKQEVPEFPKCLHHILFLSELHFHITA